MEELNTTKSVTTITQDNFDSLVVTDMGEAISLAAVTESGDLEHVVIGLDQAEKLLKLLQGLLG